MEKNNAISTIEVEDSEKVSFHLTILKGFSTHHIIYFTPNFSLVDAGTERNRRINRL